MTGLLPSTLREAVRHESLFAASASFGLVAFVLLVALMVESESIGLVRPRPNRMSGFGAFVAPLLVVVLLTILARVVRTVT